MIKKIFLLTLFVLFFLFPSVTTAQTRTTGAITGVVYQDLNSNNLRDSLRLEPGIPGWTVFVDQDWSYSADLNELSTQTLNGPFALGLVDGVYWLRRVPTGYHNVCVISETGWTSTLPGEANCREITLSSWEIETNENYGFVEKTGINFKIDVATNPLDDSVSFPIEIKQGEVVVQSLTMSDSDEPQVFTLEPGEYQVTQIIPEASGFGLYKGECLVNDEPWSPTALALETGDNVVCTFDYRKSWLEIDVVTTPSESPEVFFIKLLQGVTELDVFEMADSDTPKSYVLTPGEYEVIQTINPSSEFGLYSTTCWINNNDQPTAVLSLNPGDVARCLFDNRTGGKINVIAFHDLSGEGMQDIGEPYLEDWQFTLYFSNGCLVENYLKTSLDTDSNGFTAFKGLPAGEYSIAAALDAHPGWYVTTGECRSLSIDNADMVKEVGFGLAEILTP